MARVVTIKVRYLYPDWRFEVYFGRKKVGSFLTASLAEGFILLYNTCAELFDIPLTCDGCPEHHPRVGKGQG